MKIVTQGFTFFRFPDSMASSFVASVDEDGLIDEVASSFSALIKDRALKPVGSLEIVSGGFIPPFADAPLAVSLGNAFSPKTPIWIAAGYEVRVLPGSVVSEETAKRIAKIKEQEGRVPGARERKRIKDDVYVELLPRAFVRKRRIDAIIFPSIGLIAVGTSSQRAAEGVVGLVREVLGSFPALPINAEVAPRSVLTGWIAGEPLPDGWLLGSEATLVDPIEGGATVKVKDQELLSDEITTHLESGKQAVCLALRNGDRSSFVIDEKLTVRKVKIYEAAMDEANEDEADFSAYQQATMTIVANEIESVFGTMNDAFKLTDPQS